MRRSALFAAFVLGFTVYSIATGFELSFWQAVGIFFPVYVIICMAVPEEGEK